MNYFQNFKLDKDKRFDEELNSYGHRCDEFKTNHEGKTHVLFAGCSETWGMGGSLEEAWPAILYKEINKIEECSGFFVTAIPGGGFQDIYSLVMDYIEKFGKPKYLFILLPDFTRFRHYYEGKYHACVQDDDQWQLNQFDSPYWGIRQKFNRGEYDIENLFINYLLATRLFEKYCNAEGIKLYWSQWHQQTRQWYTEKVRNYFSNFIEFPDNYHDSIAQIYAKNNNLSILKPDNHYGSAGHKYFADVFYNKYKENHGS